MADSALLAPPTTSGLKWPALSHDEARPNGASPHPILLLHRTVGAALGLSADRGGRGSALFSRIQRTGGAARDRETRPVWICGRFAGAPATGQGRRVFRPDRN